MVRGNRGFADLIVSGGGEVARPPAARLPPRTGILGARENRLAELAAGNAMTRVHEFVDPVRCRIWEGHNRDYAALDEANCADLIESLRAQGRQEVPAVVRRIAKDPAYDYEVICGARRHWTVSWLRAHAYPEFRFLVEARELTDEEAFRLADLENRHRKDLSDYERATDYARAVERYYGGSQQRMVERLEVSKSWLSRYLELARLPAEIVASFGSPHVLGISHAAVLAPLLKAPKTRDRMIALAAVIAQEQAALRDAGGAWIPPASVLRRLTATPARRTGGGRREIVVRDPDGTFLARGDQGREGMVVISVSTTSGRPRPRILQAVTEILNQLGGTAKQG